MSIQPNAPQRRWTRTYPPLILLAIALLVAVFILPSSLNLPQSNPSTVLEYAPVPPQDDNPPPPANGNLSSLGLGSSSTLAAPPPPPPPPPLSKGRGERPGFKHCVGNPPRQTEDPQSPPCVPFFDGDNFGATYQGVTKDEIKVLIYWDAGSYGVVGQGEVSPAPDTYVDINAPAKPACPATENGVYTDPATCDHVLVRMAKGFSRYFNERYQLYKRQVHFYAFFAGASTSAGRKGDAVANWEKVHPFAVIDQAIFNGFNTDYEIAMTQLKTLAFSSTNGALPGDFYRKVAPLAWGFYPDVEHWAQMYSTYICEKIAPNPVRRYGANSDGSAPGGSKRRFGIWHTTDASHPEYQLLYKLVKQQLGACHANIVDDATFSYSGYSVNGADTGTEASSAVASFRQNKVSTVLYMGGEETRFSTAADAVRYYPEIVLAGDLHVDVAATGRLQNQNTWKNAWGQTFGIRLDRNESSPGWRAYKEGDPNGDDNAAIEAREDYRDFFMTFQAIQVAGPKLTPDTIDEGFHQIPEKPSDDPYVAAFFFDEGDYTSVKDSAEVWWDPNGRVASGSGAQPGCYRMSHEGHRSLVGKWTHTDDAFTNPNDPCTAALGGFRLRAG